MEENQPIFALSDWILQQTPIFRTDRKLFSIVTDQVFQCFLDEEMKHHYLTLSLSSIKSVKPIPNNKRPGFIITEKNGKESTFYCDSIHKTKKWVCALQLEPFTETPDISNYEKIEILGVGGYSTVFLVLNKYTGEHFALKEIEKSKVKTDKGINRVMLERNTLMRAKHPFIIRMFNAFQTPSHLISPPCANSSKK